LPPREPALDTPLDVGGVRFLVRHEFGLVRRLESAFGPLRELNRKLATQTLTANDLADLYGIALAQSERAPEREDIEAHLMRVGIVRAVEGVVPLMLGLFAGNEKASEWIRGELDKREPDDDDDILEGARRPPRAA